jgi:hypothetical protein
MQSWKKTKPRVGGENTPKVSFMSHTVHVTAESNQIRAQKKKRELYRKKIKI